MNIEICKKCKYGMILKKIGYSYKVCCIDSDTKFFKQTFDESFSLIDKLSIGQYNDLKFYHTTSLFKDDLSLIKFNEPNNNCPYKLEHELLDWNKK